MKDEQMQSLLDTWYRDRDEAPRDANGEVSRVMARVPQIRQRSRWWPPSFDRGTQTPTASDTIEYQPSPVPATNSHTPTVIGRTSSMLSPVKAITAGAIVFAIGGVMLIAQPFNQQDSMPGAATDAERAAPVEFTGQWWFNGPERLTPTETDGDPGMSRGGAWLQSPTNATDARFGGSVTVFSNDDWYSGGNAVYHDAWRVENADGAWQSEPVYNVDFADGSSSGLTAVFHGEGGYEGLVAVVDMEMVRMEQGDSQYFELNGVIFDGDLPPEPEARPLQ
jgi:hypothetical protein